MRPSACRTCVSSATARPTCLHHNSRGRPSQRQANVAVLGAHPDDVVVGAAHLCVNPVAAATVRDVVVSDGAGNVLPPGVASPAELVRLREGEEVRVAKNVGFAGLDFLRFSSDEVQNLNNAAPTQAITEAIHGVETILTHNPTDFHPTHAAVLLRVVGAIAAMPADQRPRELWGMEVWGSIDWLDARRLRHFDVECVDDVTALMKTYVSQNSIQRYDAGLAGRLAANATFADPHVERRAEGLVRLVDLSELIGARADEVSALQERYHKEAAQRQARLLDDVLSGRNAQ